MRGVNPKTAPTACDFSKREAISTPFRNALGPRRSARGFHARATARPACRREAACSSPGVRPPLGGGLAVDGTLDLEQRVEAPDGLQRDRGDRFALHAVSGPPRDIGQFEEAAQGMGEAKHRRDGLILPLRVEQRLETTIAVVIVALDGFQLPTSVACDLHPLNRLGFCL